jgi:hypothetical protein
MSLDAAHRLLILPGSALTGSSNKVRARVAVEVARGAGAEAALVDLRGPVHPWQSLQKPNMLVITEQFALPRVRLAFDTVGRLADSRQNEQMKTKVLPLIVVAIRLA